MVRNINSKQINKIIQDVLDTCVVNVSSVVRRFMEQGAEIKLTILKGCSVVSKPNNFL